MTLTPLNLINSLTPDVGMLGTNNGIGKVLPQVDGAEPGQVLQGFGDFITQQLQGVTALQQNTEKNIQAYASGADIPLHQIMISMEQSGTAMDLMLQVRNKLVGAYQELSRMQF